jgi:peptide deformylase
MNELYISSIGAGGSDKVFETDHLDGILFIDRLKPELRKKAMREIRESEWFGSAVAHGTTPVIKVSPHTTRGFGL